jgi:hypothetical protein
MLLRILRAAVRRPLAALCVSIVLGLVLGVAALATLWSSGRDHAAEIDASPRLILGRGWYDKLPEKRTDIVDFWVFLGGGIGLKERGSTWQASYEIFEFERQGSKLEITSLQTKKRTTTAFTVDKCDENPPFNLCLTLKDMPGGAVKLYGFQYEEDMERAIPWGKNKLEAARALAAAPGR